MKILFTAEYDEKYIDQLKKIGDINIQGWARGIGKLSEKQLIELVSDREVIVTSYDDITKKIIDAAPNLKLIACTRATPVNIDTKYANQKGIKVIYTPGRNSDSTAEHTIALMLSVLRNIPQAYMALKEQKFTSETDQKNQTKDGLREDVVWGFGEDSPYVVFKGHEMKNKKLGIVGFGSIGRRVAHLATAFGMEILVYDPYVANIEIDRVGQKKVDFETLLRDSDIITVHLKVSEATRGIFNRESFAKMKPTAYFINCARAAVMDEGALIEALKTKKIQGAAVDVFEHEPIWKNHPYITELDNIVMTPHIAGATEDVLSNHTLMIIQELRRFKNNEPLLYEYK